MTVVIGAIIVIASVLGGFSWAGGHMEALIHPSELLTIGGSAMGAMVMMAPGKVIKDLVHSLVITIKGSPYNKSMYRDLFALAYDLLRLARRDGILAMERHISAPHESEIFNKYPKIAADHHVVEFMCGGFAPLIEGSSPEQTAALLHAEIKVREIEHHAPIDVLSKTADALPGFGIVAAVLGIVITMGAINGPIEEVGHKVGAALVGTFLGILMSYGFIAPLCVKMEFQSAAESEFFRTMATIIIAFANANPPKVALEQARRGVGTANRLDWTEMDQLLSDAEAA